MLESEEFCDKNDEKKERLYFASGYGLIQCVKALMSYEDDVSFLSFAHVLLSIFGSVLLTDLNVGSASRNRTYKTWKFCRQLASQEASVSWIHIGRIRSFVPSFVGRWLYQEYD